jgi:hypothetical protein
VSNMEDLDPSARQTAVSGRYTLRKLKEDRSRDAR